MRSPEAGARDRAVPGGRTAAARRAGLALVLALALALAACGGGSSGSGSGGSGSGGSLFPERGGGESPLPPPSVQTARVVFDSASGERCCVTVPASAIPAGALLVLDDLPAGPATVYVAFFAEDFAPAVDGISATCQTVPASLGSACDPLQVASPSFESDPLTVNIIAGGQTNVDDLVIHALPFVFDFTPVNEAVVETPVDFGFTVADAVTDIEPDSVVLEITVQVPDGPLFRPLTKRLPVTLDACADGTPRPCSTEGNRELAGFRAASGAALLAPGPVAVRILAINRGEPPQDVDFHYGFEVTE